MKFVFGVCAASLHKHPKNIFLLFSEKTTKVFWGRSGKYWNIFCKDFLYIIRFSDKRLSEIMSTVVASEKGHVLQKKTTSSLRQTRAGKWIAILLLFLLVMPTFNMIPTQRVGGLNRPITELVNFIIVAIWIWIRISYGKSVELRPRWFEAAFWLLPVTFVLSDLVFAFNGGHLSTKHFYEFLNSFRPIAFIQLSMFILRQGKVESENFSVVMKYLVRVISGVVIYIGLLAVLQIQRIGVVQNFLHFFYRFEGGIREEIAYLAIQHYGRATSIFHWGNSLGEFLTVALLILFVYFLNRPKKRTIYLPAIAIGLFGIVLSGSRMALIALAVGMFVILLLKRQFKILFIVMIAGLIILYAMDYVAQRTGQSSRFSELFNFISGTGAIPPTLQTRLTHTSKSLSAFTYEDISQWTGTTVTDYQSIVPESFDNEYLKYLVWNGYLGLVAFILFQAGIIFRSWLAFKLFPPGTSGNMLSLALLAVSMSMVFSAYSQDTWGGERTLQLVFILLGVLVYFRNLQFKKPASSAKMN
jgi:hypothetical protein